MNWNLLGQNDIQEGDVMNVSSELKPEQNEKLGRLLEAARSARDRSNEAKKQFEGDRTCMAQQEIGAKKTPWWYILALIAITAVEWMINFQSFLSYLDNVPFMAAGFTIAVAIIVAFASHEHGTYARQPYFRNAMRHTHADHDLGITILFIFSVIMFVLALIFVGWARYSYTVEMIKLSGGEEVNVLLKVSVSLISNVLVWGIGCWVAYVVHSKGRYTPRHKEKDRTEKVREKAEAKLRKYSDALIADAPADKQAEVADEIKSRTTAALPTLAVLMLLVSTAIPTLEIEAQVFSEYDIDQFCSDEFIENAKPFRQTIVYYDENTVRDAISSDVMESAEETTKSLLDVPWLIELEGKLRGSLQPSERVFFVSLSHAATSSQKEVADYCWPDYTEKRREELKDRGLLSTFFSRDPLADLDTQQNVFFGRIRQGIAENTINNRSSKRTAGMYVTALTRDESRLRPRRGEIVRLIWHGDMVENSSYGHLGEVEDSAKFASDIVKRTSLNLGGTVFYLFGMIGDDLYDDNLTFWDELIHRAGGYLGSAGTELALTAKIPSEIYTLELEFEMAPPENLRRGKLTLVVAESGDLVDSSIVIGGQNRSVITGNLDCSGGQTICDSQCLLDTEMRRSVMFKALDRESIVLEGEAGTLSGFIGQPDEGQTEEERAHKTVVGHVQECQI